MTARRLAISAATAWRLRRRRQVQLGDGISPPRRRTDGDRFSRLHRPRGADVPAESGHRRALPAPVHKRKESARAARRGRLRLRAERRPAADVDVAPLPERPGHSSGQLGRHFIPHFTGGFECVLEGLRGSRRNDEGFLDHAYLPSFAHLKKDRGYARSLGAVQLPEPALGRLAKTLPGFGKAFKESVKAPIPPSELHAVR